MKKPSFYCWGEWSVNRDVLEQALSFHKMEHDAVVSPLSPALLNDCWRIFETIWPSFIEGKTPFNYTEGQAPFHSSASQEKFPQDDSDKRYEEMLTKVMECALLPEVRRCWDEGYRRRETAAHLETALSEKEACVSSKSLQEASGPKRSRL